MKTENTENTSDTKKTSMSEAAREARNAYKRKWAKNNRDKVNAANRRYWEKKAQEAQTEEA